MNPRPPLTFLNKAYAIRELFLFYYCRLIFCAENDGDCVIAVGFDSFDNGEALHEQPQLLLHYLSTWPHLTRVCSVIWQTQAEALTVIYLCDWCALAL